jgi:hypothetical protein
LIALSDPNAVGVNRLDAQGKLEIFISPITLGETLKALATPQINAEVAKRCKFILNLSALRVLADPPGPLRHELLSDEPHARIPLASPGELATIRNFLYYGSLNALPRSAQDQIKNSFTEGRLQTESHTRMIVSHPNRQIARLFPTFESVLSDARTDPLTITRVSEIARLAGCSPASERVSLAIEQAFKNPKSKPYLAGNIRSNLFTGWHAAQHGTMGFQDDVKTILPSLLVDCVWSNDTKLVKRGQIIYPEISWLQPQGWDLESLEEFASNDRPGA